MRKAAYILVACSLALTGCTSAADRANENLSEAAENFEVERRIVGINGITDKVLFSVEGYCSLENDGAKLDVLCRVDGNPRQRPGAGEVERTTLGLSDNVTYLSTQLNPVRVDFYRPRIIIAPENIVPNFDLATSNR